MAVLHAIYTPSLPFEVRCESGIYTSIHTYIHTFTLVRKQFQETTDRWPTASSSKLNNVYTSIVLYTIMSAGVGDIIVVSYYLSQIMSNLV